ncbi:MAG: hypothetical protein IPL84_00690 [Chitinophagaceae bacterium]|nr:hypothetical protein [Chitinophagaceae bacterium]
MTNYSPILFFLLLLLWTADSINAQQLTGVWSGKISRNVKGTKATVESLEIQLSQFGNTLWGNSFAFKDTSRYVLYRIEGKIKRKLKLISINELGRPAYILPDGFYPCEKVYRLGYSRIGKTEYLSGTWGGRGAYSDTTCFPNEDLLVVLQKIPKPDYPIENFVAQKLVNYYTRQKYPDRTNTNTTDSLLLSLYNSVDDKPVVEDSSLANRAIDIQMILKVPDSLVSVTLYDNAIIDDDTVSVFVNKKAFLVKQRISAQPLSFSFKMANANQPTEILMQAENLGSIPPNTALMIVESGNKRQEVRLSSGYGSHAAIIITFSPDNQP